MDRCLSWHSNLEVGEGTHVAVETNASILGHSDNRDAVDTGEVVRSQRLPRRRVAGGDYPLLTARRTI